MAKSLLLADDSVTIHRMVELCLPPDKFTVIAAKSAEEALARARELRPDVILADTFMPGKNGYDLAAAVQSDRDLSHIPVVLLTSPNEAFDEERARAAGAFSWLAKPFGSQALSDQVKNALAPRPAAPAPPPPAPIIAPPPPAVAAPAPAPEPLIVRPPPPTDISMPPPPREELLVPREATMPPLSVFPSLAPLPQSIAPPAEPLVVAPQPMPAATIPPPNPAAPIVQAAPGPVKAPARPGPVASGRPVMPPRPAGIPVPQPRATLSAQNHEALLREALTKASRDMIEKIVWEVVPELAETMIREQLERLVKKQQA